MTLEFGNVSSGSGILFCFVTCGYGKVTSLLLGVVCLSVQLVLHPAMKAFRFLDFYTEFKKKIGKPPLLHFDSEIVSHSAKLPEAHWDGLELRPNHAKCF